ncbi:MAG: type II toxin-antitoxin system RelE/ParE family toxin [Oscillospiraceae bacterium]|nr:type II toxin-antitoxin system RelE/ParE family toxin [Oscillospiraceae bacterium]
MMYQIIIQKKAKKFIDHLPCNERRRVVAAIEQLPDGEDIKRLKGHPDLLRLRVGSYRIIYSLDNGKLIVYIIDAGSRGQIYNSY